MRRGRLSTDPTLAHNRDVKDRGCAVGTAQSESEKYVHGRIDSPPHPTCEPDASSGQ